MNTFLKSTLLGAYVTSSALATTPPIASDRTPLRSDALLPHVRPLPPLPEAPSKAEALDKIGWILNMNRTELAKAMGVSRQRIYDWLSGSPLGQDSQARLDLLTTLSLQIEPHVTRLNARVVKKLNLPDLLSELSTPAQFNAMAQQLVSSQAEIESTSLSRLLEKKGLNTVSEDQQAHNLSVNTSLSGL